MERRRLLRLFVLTGLYVGQGIPYGFVAVAVANYFTARGASIAEVGNLTALATLPWAFKWAWGPLLDRFDHLAMGRRRPWILAAQTLIASACGVIVFIPSLSGTAAQLGWVILVQNIFVSLQDVSVDALAVDLLPEEDRGKANGLMYGGAYLGMMIGGAGLSNVVEVYGLRAGFAAELVLTVGIMVLPLLVREREADAFFSAATRPSTRGPRPSTKAFFGNLLRAFLRRSPAAAAMLALVVNLGLGALGPITSALFIKHLGWQQVEYSQLTGGIGVLFGLTGAVAGGVLADLFGHRRFIATATCALGIAWIGFALAQPQWSDRTFVTVFTCGQAFVSSALMTSMFTLFMDVSWPRVAATQFTAFMALLNVSSTVGKKLAGPLIDHLSFAGCFVVLGIAQAAIAALLPAIDPGQNRRELGE